MKHLLHILLIAVPIVGLLSCSSKKEEAKELVSAFFTAATDSTSGLKTSDYYSTYDILSIQLKSDVLDINDEVESKDDTLIVTGQNSYTSENGVFTQDSIKFFISKVKGKEGLQIISSIGLIKVPDFLEQFAKSLNVSLEGKKDFQLNDLLINLNKFYTSKAFDAYMELFKGVQITYWDWETDYSEEPHGQGWLKNNLDITISDIKYTVTYYDRNHNFISDDTGTACRSLKPGEKYRFSFYTSHVKYPSKANLKLDFTSANIDKILYSKRYTKADFDKFCKEVNK